MGIERSRCQEEEKSLLLQQKKDGGSWDKWIVLEEEGSCSLLTSAEEKYRYGEISLRLPDMEGRV